MQIDIPTQHSLHSGQDEIFDTLGVKVHCCQPHNSNAKFIERCFRDLGEHVVHKVIKAPRP